MSLYKSRQRGSVIFPALLNAFVRIYTRLKVEGQENLPLEGSFLIAANHQSHADTAMIFAAVPKVIRKRFVAAAAQDYFFQGGLPQYFSRVWFNAIPVARDRRGGRDPMRHLGRALREGYAVMMFPEGTRSSGELPGPFRAGIGKLLAEFPETPVVPTWIGGTARVLPKGVYVPRPFRTYVRFGSPLLIKAHPRFRATWQSAADEIREAILQLGDYPVMVSDSGEAEAE
ncbi:MAG: 1-acyl-sn-glycerol-3-phosphate acyltransferase [Candidatus Viridilinea halotolerans]|uniref:1-acyl-sn-glycerol-3-phosphate acyltransferase n=1 Tax=Candidatus Viridilinea halotolerans TaxID=2491704 RepID=A0A426TY61_9CHLR|nr:MAG: 1-acyl-sn-glycerol-3-phosphate acyltransferase [Candidatus Viridilinea halotolerans]